MLFGPKGGRFTAALVILGAVAACEDEGGAGGSGATGGGGAGQPPFRVALSISPFSETLFDAGASFTDGERTAGSLEELQALYVAQGATEVFTRISTERARTTAPDDHSMEGAKKRAAIAKSLGLPLNPELGLWKHYGDITCAPGPDFAEYTAITTSGPWETLTVDEMVPPLVALGAAIAQELVATGATIEVWDIGNEVDLGVAGVAPEGIMCSTPYAAPDAIDPVIGTMTVLEVLQMPEADRIAWLEDHVWPHEARLLAAVAEGIRSVVPEARVATHMSQSLSPTFALAFYEAMESGGFAPDTIGFSYYPSASDTPNRVAAFKSTVAAIQDRFGKPVFIAEFAYPAGATATGPYATWMNETPNYPIGEAGQAAFLRDLTAWAMASGVSGIRPWAPEIFVEGWEGFALFEAGATYPVTARQGLTSMAEGLASPGVDAFHD